MANEKKEIGGYIELDKYELPMLHEGAIALNSGRSCLAYLIRAHGIKRILLPKFLCSSISDICQKEQVHIKYYSVNTEFLPLDINLEDGEWLYLVNYYGQIYADKMQKIVSEFERVIVDQSQAYFQMPLKGIDTLYTSRKFFGVADGAFLYTDTFLREYIERDESYNRISFLFGRFEREATEFYKDYVMNNERFTDEPIKRMSKVTENMLHGINYHKVKEIRTQNFTYLHSRLGKRNRLELCIPEGAFMYPLYIEGGQEIRKSLQREKIYIPLLWPNVLEECRENELEYDMASNILPLPIDQRYGYPEMDIVATLIEQNLKRLGE